MAIFGDYHIIYIHTIYIMFYICMLIHYLLCFYIYTQKNLIKKAKDCRYFDQYSATIDPTSGCFVSVGIHSEAWILSSVLVPLPVVQPAIPEPSDLEGHVSRVEPGPYLHEIACFF